MDTFAALALATDPADPEENLKRKPEKPDGPLISIDMWKMIIVQSIYQITVALVLHFAGARILGYNATDTYQRIQNEDRLKTLVFNQFVFCQIFNSINARRLDRGLNVFRGLFKNYWFCAIFLVMVGGQALIVNVGGTAFQVTRINGQLWAISIIIGLISLPIGAFVRLLPTAPFERFAIRHLGFADPNNPKPATKSTGPKKSLFNLYGLLKFGKGSDNDAITDEKGGKVGAPLLQDQLDLYTRLRSGRMGSSAIARQRNKRKPWEQKNVYPTTIMTMVPSMVLATVGAGSGFRPGGAMDPHAPANNAQHQQNQNQSQNQQYLQPSSAAARST